MFNRSKIWKLKFLTEHNGKYVIVKRRNSEGILQDVRMYKTIGQIIREDLTLDIWNKYTEIDMNDILKALTPIGIDTYQGVEIFISYLEGMRNSADKFKSDTSPYAIAAAYILFKFDGLATLTRKYEQGNNFVSSQVLVDDMNTTLALITSILVQVENNVKDMRLLQIISELHMKFDDASEEMIENINHYVEEKKNEQSF